MATTKKKKPISPKTGAPAMKKPAMPAKPAGGAKTAASKKK